MVPWRTTDDPPDYCPCPPDGRARIVEAVIVAAATAFFIYDEIKVRRGEKK